MWTNNANLPAPLVSAITYSDYDKVGDISVTSLLLPPRIRQLTRRHANEIVEDISEGIWRLMGSMGHKILERADTDNHLPEERLTTQLHGWTVSGKADLLAPDMTLSDYKFTSVWAMKDEKKEWTEQLNLYAWLYRHNGFEVKAARIVGILRDWSKPKAAREPDYPQQQVVVRHVPLWSAEEQEALAGLHVRAHQQAEKLSDDDLPLCTPEERWTRPDVYAVKKKGNKRATKLFETEADAAEMIRAFNGDLIVERRPGEDVRCQVYCAVKNFCSYGKTLVPASEAAA
jgi:hypothetical protein